MRIATWNVNSIRARKQHVLNWLSDAKPDVVLLQELKVIDSAFPHEEVGDLGYNISVHGQKTYNGVAILAKQPIDDVLSGLPGNEDDPQARYLEANIGDVRVASIYLPNGNPVDSDKFSYKLNWMQHLVRRTEILHRDFEAVVLGGDFNLIPEDRDCFNPAQFADDALARPESRALFRTLLYQGWTDAYRAIHPHAIGYSYWDYQRGAWQKDNGIRIDHLLLSPEAADRLQDANVDKGPRGKEKPSDHTPVWCQLADA